MKDFTQWSKRKTEINNQKRLYFHQNEIWFCHIGINIGFEQDGKGQEFIRPVIIFKKFNNETLWAIPLSKQEPSNKNSKYYYSFSFIENITSCANLSQLRLVDSQRLVRKIGNISTEDSIKLKEKLKELIP